jgi:hypothetical protein
MILKIIKAVWFLSVVAVMTVFMYVYASLPESVEVHGGPDAVLISREGIFYGMLVLIALVNVLVLVILRLHRGRPEFPTWFCGLIITLNLFFIVALSYISLFNSGENFRYERLGIIIYGSVWLVIAWTAAWPVYALVTRITNKATV